MKLILKTGGVTTHWRSQAPGGEPASSSGQGEFWVGNRTGSVKQDGWQLQRTKERPCQSAYFVARPAGFDGRLLQQPENSVPDYFNREMKIFTK